MKLSQLLYMPIWYFKNVWGKKHGPLQTVLFITDHCNLKCKHCFEMGHANSIQKSYEQIKEELEYSYNLGSRIVDFEGGEPTLWHETNKDTGEKRNLQDLIRLAKDIGFFTCTITTNAQIDFTGFHADCIWISMDGNARYHDMIRGEGSFAKLEENVKAYSVLNPRAYIGANIAINKINKDSVEEAINYCYESPYIGGMAINFHTPYPGTEDLMLDQKEKCEIIDKILLYKRTNKMNKIINSNSGLKMMKNPLFKKNCWMTNFITPDGTRLDTCPGDTLGICENCGFCMAGEETCITKLKPDTLLAGLKLRL